MSARRIRVKEVPLESHPEKLRKVLFESLMVTAAYQASRALGTTLTLTAEQIYLEQRGRTKRQDLEDHYRALIALGLCDERERDARLGTDADFGASTFVIENQLRLRRVRRDVPGRRRQAAPARSTTRASAAGRFSR